MATLHMQLDFLVLKGPLGLRGSKRDFECT